MNNLTNLLKKEFTLAMHPTAIIFPLLSLLVFVPNYPYEVTFFFTTLSIFFISLQGRENDDLFFSATLPVSKGEIVSARIFTIVTLELLQMLLLTIFSIIKTFTTPSAVNLAGLEANVALIAFGFIIYGTFNLTFITRYFKYPTKVGSSFIISTIYTFVIITLSITLCFAFPDYAINVDVNDLTNTTAKWLLVALGLIIYLVFTILSSKIAVKRFEKVDL